MTDKHDIHNREWLGQLAGDPLPPLLDQYYTRAKKHLDHMGGGNFSLQDLSMMAALVEVFGYGADPVDAGDPEQPEPEADSPEPAEVPEPEHPELEEPPVDLQKGDEVVAEIMGSEAEGKVTSVTDGKVRIKFSGDPAPYREVDRDKVRLKE